MMKRVAMGALAGAALLFAIGQAGAAEISGAGATFPYPIYAKWADAYKTKTGIGLNYQSIGSGGGIKQIESKTVDFGASDMPLEPKDLEKAGLMQFPMVMGAEVAVVNLKGINAGDIKLTGPVLADIYLEEDRQLERSRPRQAQSGRQAARSGDHGCPSLRRLRHHLHLHPLPLADQPRMEIDGGREHLGPMADGRGRQRQ